MTLLAVNPLNVIANLRVSKSRQQTVAVQSDSFRPLAVDVYDGDTKLLNADLTQFTTIAITYTPSHGPAVVHAGEVVGDSLSFPLGTLSASTVGLVRASIQLYQTDGRVSTMAFPLEIIKDGAGYAYVPSVKERTLIEKVLNDGPAIVASASTATTNADGARAAADAATTTANTAATNADTKAQLAQTKADYAQTQGALVAQKLVETDLKIIEVDDKLVEATAKIADTEAVRVATDSERLATSTERGLTETERLATEAVKDATEGVRVATEGVRVATEGVRVATEGVRVATEAERLATETERLATVTVKDATETERLATVAVKDATESERLATEAERIATSAVKSDTLVVKNDTLTAKANTETATANATTQANYALAQGDYAKQVANENKNVLLAPVANFASIATTYPSPALGSKVQTTDNGKIYRWNGSTWAYIEEMNNNMLTDIQTQLNETARQTTTLTTGTSIVNGGVDALADVEIEGRTLTSLGNSNLEANKTYVLADKKTKVIVQDGVSYTAPTTSGVAKFTRAGTTVATGNYVGKVVGSTVVNPHKMGNKPNVTSLTTPSNFNEEGNQTRINNITTFNGIVDSQTAAVNGGIGQALFSFDIIAEIERKLGVIPRTTLADKVQWVKDNVENITANWHGFGSSVGGNKATFVWWDSSNSTWSGSYSHTNSTITKLTNLTGAPSVRVDVSGFVHLLAYAEPSDGITASSVSTDFIDLVVTLKSTAQLNTRPTLIRVENFEGKVSGSTVENPHKESYGNVSTTLLAPSSTTFIEHSQANYNNLSTLNGVNSYYPTTSNGAIAQQLFSFNLIEAVERNIGRIPRASVADKVAWLKANVSKITANWHGYGSSVGGNKASLAVWNTSSNNWENTASHTSSIVAIRTSGTTTINVRVDANGLIHYLAYAEPSDGTTASTINTDYIDLEVELKPTADFTRPRTALYEVDSATYAKVLVDWDADETIKRFPSVEGTQHLQGVNVTAEGENLLPPFTEGWTIHANAKVLSPYELELNATGAGQSSGYKLPVMPNTIYSFNSSGISKFSIDEQGATGNYLRGKVSDTQNSTFTTSSDCYFLYFYTRNSTTGTFIFKNPMLTLGNVAKPFVPRNASSFLADVKLGAMGTSKDVLYESEGQRYVRKSVEKDVALGGDLAWVFNLDFVGFKRVIIFNYPVGASTQLVTLNATKSNGSVVKGASTNATGGDKTEIAGGHLYLNVSDTDTGFGETYTPTTAETKAYFYGYQMNNGTFGTPYNGTGTKTWIPIGDTANTRAVTVVPTSASPTQVDGTIQPYKLSYVLATPQIVNVTDKVEGQLKVNGSTQVSVESGFVRREKVVPYSGVLSYYVINREDGIYGVSKLSRKVKNILAVYKNGAVDSQWVIGYSAVAYGNMIATIDKVYFDTTAEYTVTYVALDKHLLTNATTSVKLAYANNVRSALEDAVGKVQDNTTQLSVHEKAIVDLYVRVKALGG